MFCPKCGSSLKEGDMFCRECGAPVNQVSKSTDKISEHTEIISDIEESKSELSAAMESNQLQDVNQLALKEFSDAGEIKEVHHAGNTLRKVIIISVISIIFLFLAGFGLVKFSNAVTVRNDMKLGNKYLEEGKYEEAIIAFSKIIKIDKKNIQARVDLGKAYNAAGKADEAEKVLKEAISIDAKRYEPYVELAKIYISLGEIDKASKILPQGYAATANENIKQLQNEIAAKYVRGNTIGNLLNFGYFVEQGDWIYGRDFDGATDGLYKYKKDGTNKVKLSDDTVIYVNVVGDWIYFDGNGSIYKIKTDGTNLKKLNENFGYCITVVGDWVYFCEQTDIASAIGPHYLYKMKTDGTQLTKLCNDEMGQSNRGSFINVVGDWIYYINMSDQGYAYKIKTDGTGRTKCSFDSYAGLGVVGDWTYYSNEKDGGKLYKMKADGTVVTKLSDDIPIDINVSGDFIYYLNVIEQNQNIYKLCKIKTDGTGRADVTNDEIYSNCLGDMIGREINLAGDWIFYDSYRDQLTYEYYRVKTDGTEKELIYKQAY